VKTLNFFFIGEGLHVGRYLFLFRSIELDGSTASDYYDAIITVFSSVMNRNIRIRSVVGDAFSRQLLAIGRTSKFSMQDGRPVAVEHP
jgi:hypothetical protein